MLGLRAICDFSGAQKYVGCTERIRRGAVRQMKIVLHDALRKLTGDYLRRGGTFRRTKGKSVYRGPGGKRLPSPGGRQWVKNLSQWLRVGNGVLVSSWHVLPVQAQGLKVTGVLGTSCPYARIHEEGGDTGWNHATHLRKRSAIAPMLRDHSRRWGRELGYEVVAELRKV